MLWSSVIPVMARFWCGTEDLLLRFLAMPVLVWGWGGFGDASRALAMPAPVPAWSWETNVVSVWGQMQGPRWVPARPCRGAGQVLGVALPWQELRC